MQRSSYILMGVGAALAVLVSVPFLLPLDTYRAPMERAATAAMGREVHIKGPVHLAIYPELGLSLGGVSIANDAGARDPQLITVDTLLVGARLIPLFSRRLEVTELVLEKPLFHLEVGKAGVSNWQSLGASRPAPAAAANPAHGTKAASVTAHAQTGHGVAIRNVRIKNGELTYFDARSNNTEAVHDISVSLDLPGEGLPGRTQPVSIAGDVTYNAQPLKISVKLDNLNAVQRLQPTGMHVAISSSMINADFAGTLGAEGNLSGALKLGARSIRSLAIWLGHPMQPGNGFGLMALDGQFSVQNGVYTLSHTHLAFDSMNINANVSIDTNADVLMLKGGAEIDKLDINPYLAPGNSEDTVKAAKAKADNPNAPLALGWLKSANADMTLIMGGLSIPDFKLDHAVAKIILNGGVLKADLSSIAVYGGAGKGNIVVDASGNTPAFRESLDFTGFKTRPMLDDLLDAREITSTGNLHVDLSARGATERQIVEGLYGKGEIRFSNGSIAGVDLAAVARVIQSLLTGQTLGAVVGNKAQTPFEHMGGSFVVENGVLRTDDLTLVNPDVQMEARGSVDLPDKSLDFHFIPKARKGMPGLNLVDIGFPFNVKGPWKHPNYTPDARGIAKRIVRKLEDDAAIPVDVLKKPGKTLKSLLGR